MNGLCVWELDRYLGDVLLYPLQHEALIQHAGVEVPVTFDLLAREKPEETDAVVEVDEYHVVAGCLDNLRAIPVGVGEKCVSYMVFYTH